MSKLVQAAASGPPGALLRSDWRAGQELTAFDLDLEQSYRDQRLRRHLRLAHGWGIVCGLTVVSAQEDWMLFVCPGYGIGPCGDEIFVPQRKVFNLRDYLWTRPLEVNNPAAVWILLEPGVEGPSSSSGCGCGCTSDESATAEARISVAWSAPPHSHSAFNLCGRGIPPCPRCPEDCGLTLAVVSLPKPVSTSTGLFNSNIQNL